jgi:hypothetical protein
MLNPYELDEAIARHYARQQEGLPPSPRRPQHWTAHRRWLSTYYPVPSPVGGWMRPIPSFDWFLEHQWPAIAAEIAATASPPDLDS